MGNTPIDKPMDIEDVLTVLANIADWQRQLAPGALRQLQEGKGKRPVEPPPSGTSET